MPIPPSFQTLTRTIRSTHPALSPCALPWVAIGANPDPTHTHTRTRARGLQGTVSDSKSGNVPEQRTVLARLAYLIDMQTIRIMDLLTNTTLATLNHDTRVDWVVGAWAVPAAVLAVACIH